MTVSSKAAQNPPAPSRSAVYARGASAESVARQVAACKAAAASKGLTVADDHVYVDTVPTDDTARPGLAALEALLAADGADVVVVATADRLSRDPLRLAAILGKRYVIVEEANAVPDRSEDLPTVDTAA